MQQDAKSVSFNRISNSPILPQRHAPGALPENLTLQKSKGAGKTGCAPHPRSRAQCCRGMLRPSKQVWRKPPAFPAQWLYGLYVIALVTLLFVTPSPPEGRVSRL